jgi:hypothetical protein
MAPTTRSLLLQKQKFVYDIMQRTDDDTLNGVTSSVVVTTELSTGNATSSKSSEEAKSLSQNDFELSRLSPYVNKTARCQIL